MSQNMKTLLPNTKFYNFSRKFLQVAVLSVHRVIFEHTTIVTD